MCFPSNYCILNSLQRFLFTATFIPNFPFKFWPKHTSATLLNYHFSTYLRPTFFSQWAYWWAPLSLSTVSTIYGGLRIIVYAPKSVRHPLPSVHLTSIFMLYFLSIRCMLTERFSFTSLLHIKFNKSKFWSKIFYSHTVGSKLANMGMGITSIQSTLAKSILFRYSSI